MKDDKITSYTFEEVKKILETIKGCVRAGRFEVPTNDKRKENREFIDEYKLTTEKIKNILLGIAVNDFCYGIKDDKRKTEVLYVFCPLVSLKYGSINVEIVVYTKFSIKTGSHVVVVSFHPRNVPESYLFD